MRFEQTRDVLEHTRHFHGKLARFYENLAENEAQERMRLLLEYFGRHERRLTQSLRRFEEQTASEILDTWLDFTHDEEVLCFPKDLDIHPQMSVDEVIGIAMQLDQCLIRLYRELAQQTDVPEVREVFQALLQMEEKERDHVAQQAERLNDL